MSDGNVSLQNAIVAIRTEARNEAFEEAAKVAELRMVFGGEPPTPHHRMVIEHIATAIRGLKK
jgi:hypothetical protein